MTAISDKAVHTIGKYVVERQLGSGMMGTVYLAHDSQLDRRVAIKVMKAGIGDDMSRARFLLEARSTAKLDHPNIIRVWDLATDLNNRLYIAMEYVEGEDLKTLIQREAFLPFEYKLKIIIEVCMGLQNAHNNGIIHRDIKPGNIRINKNGQAKILDFGLARLDSAEMSGTIGPLGTPYYMSPEQWRGGRDVDHRSDLFSVGVVLYELISGVRPFEASDISAVMTRIVGHPHLPLKHLLPATSPVLDQILDRALAKNHQERYPNCLDLARALQSYQTELPQYQDEVRQKIASLEAHLRSRGKMDKERPSTEEAEDYGFLLHWHAGLQEQADSLSAAMPADIARDDRHNHGHLSAQGSIFQMTHNSNNHSSSAAPASADQRHETGPEHIVLPGATKTMDERNHRSFKHNVSLANLFKKDRQVKPRTPSSQMRRLVSGLTAILLLAMVGMYAFRDVATPREPTPLGPERSAPPPVINTPLGEMVLVPEGVFQQGQHRTTETLPAYYIDRTEVTNAAYGTFCKDTGRPLPAGFSADRPEYPVVNVTISDARAFAEWAGKRLPRAKEWEKAARSTDGREYPWGNPPDTSKANVARRPGKGALAAADSYREGASAYGVLNMAGNVWEYIDEPVDEPSAEALKRWRELKPPPTRDERFNKMMGGSYAFSLQPGLTWDYAAVPARAAEAAIGFRCVMDLK